MSTFPAVLRRIAVLSFTSACVLAAAAQAVPALAPETPSTIATAAPGSTAAAKHNVIIVVADGLRRGSVNAKDMPTFARLRAEGTDLRNSHSVFPTFTTANASVIATGHGLGDTGDFSNVVYPGLYLSQPLVATSVGSVTPFLEADDVLANLNGNYARNYLGEQTLMSAARAAGYSVASIGKLGPTAIQQIESVNRDEFGAIAIPDTLIIDDATGHPTGVPLPLDFQEALFNSGLPIDAPTRSNGYGDSSQGSNGFSGDAATPGTRAANLTQQQWLADVTTQVVLPRFAAAGRPFVLLFWSRDPDGTQHNQGDSLQNLTPGINGETVARALRNVDNNLKQLLDWLDKNPAIKATTDVIVTSDHGFATVSRRELSPGGGGSVEPSTGLSYEPSGKDKPEPEKTLPTGFLAIDLALWSHQRVFDPAVRATTGESVYSEVVLNGEKAHYPSGASALLGDSVKKLDGSDARLIVAANGGSDLIYVPTHDPAIVQETLATLSDLDYVGGLFVDDAYCPTATSCPGALPLSSIGLKGATKMPTPAIVVTYKVFYLKAGDLQTAAQVSDTTLQEGQGMHGGFGRDQTWNNMAAIGPDFKQGIPDDAPVGNIDIAPTVASILGIELPSKGHIKGRVLTEALVAGVTTGAAKSATLVSAPNRNGRRTVLDYQQLNGVSYYDRACMTAVEKDKPVCPQ
jgi:predicted AlkP superfamily pyrophosphatase or phosphodiesterase